jgi:hypothetical protein
LPVSVSMNSLSIFRPLAFAYCATASRCASKPRPERSCFFVETR